MAETGTPEVRFEASYPGAPGSAGREVFSVGHSNVQPAVLLELLGRHRIEVVADVRSAPRSRFVPHFDAGPLQRSLADVGIRYVALGAQLGGRPDGDEYYDAAGHVLYDKVARSAPFVGGIKRLLDGAARFRIALLCGEEDPTHCHRHLLISRVLATKGVDVGHLRHDGTLLSEQALVRAEQAVMNPAQPLLFQPSVEERTWRSSRSVSRRRAQRSSSGP